MTPSNVTIKEFVKYYVKQATPEEIEEQFNRLLDELEELRTASKQFDRTEEILREQISFARGLVTNINEQATISHKEARKNSKEWELANYDICQIEESYFEL